MTVKVLFSNIHKVDNIKEPIIILYIHRQEFFARLEISRWLNSSNYK